MRYIIIFFAISFCCIGNDRLSLSTTYYADDRGYDTLNVEMLAKLPLNFSLWGFTDFNGYQDEGHGEFDRSFSEYRLSYPIGKGFGIQAEYNRFTPSGVDVGRIGLTYKHSLTKIVDGGWLQWRLFPIETDGNGGQVSLIYLFPITEKISISGFADINWDEEGSDRWVIEPQLNYKVNDTVSFHLEYRYNGFEDIGDDGDGVALGVKFKF